MQSKRNMQASENQIEKNRKKSKKKLKIIKREGHAVYILPMSNSIITVQMILILRKNPDPQLPRRYANGCHTFDGGMDALPFESLDSLDSLDSLGLSLRNFDSRSAPSGMTATPPTGFCD